MRDRLNDAVARPADPAWEDIDGEVFVFSDGNGRPDKSDPDYQVAHKWIAPVDSGGKKVAEHDLQEGQQNHRRQQDSNEDFFQAADFFIQIIQEVQDLPHGI